MSNKYIVFKKKESTKEVTSQHLTFILSA